MLVLVNLDGFQPGVEEDETGINIQSFTVRYFPERKVKVPNKQGETLGFAVSELPSTDITLNGHVTGTDGLMDTTFAVAYAFANDTNEFNQTGGTYIDENTVTQTAEGLRMLDARASSNPLVP
jgi:hypothetical protein